MGGNKNKTNSKTRSYKEDYGENKEMKLEMRQHRAIRLSGRIVELLMENLYCALMNLCGAMEQKYLSENRQRK